MDGVIEEIIETFKDRSAHTALTIIFVLLGITTIIFYQKLVVSDINQFFSTMNDEGIELLKTWGANLFSSVGLSGVGAYWIKDAFSSRYYYEGVVSRTTCFITGLLCFAFSIMFIHFIFTKMLVVLVIAIMVIGWLNSGKK